MPLEVERLVVPDVLVLQPKVFGDERGFFVETWNESELNEAVGAPVRFVQDNHSRSAKGVLRGLHYQLPAPQGKLIRVAVGAVFDVAVDIRQSSRTFGQHVTVELSAENKRHLWVPPGFAHGFLVLSDSADLFYKVTDYYDPSSEHSVRWDDPELGIEWPAIEPLLSNRDRDAAPLAEACLFE